MSMRCVTEIKKQKCYVRIAYHTMLDMSKLSNTRLTCIACTTCRINEHSKDSYLNQYCFVTKLISCRHFTVY